MDDKHKTEPLGQFLKEAATERAPLGFSRAVMDRIEALEATREPAPPLIPGWAWALIAVTVVALCGWGWMAGNGGGQGFLPESVWGGWMEEASLPSWELPTLPLSLVYGVSALTLFLLLQVVWMRRRMDRHWVL